MLRLLLLGSVLLSIFLPVPRVNVAHGIFADGEGHYSLKGQTENAPGFSSSKGTHQAIHQYFRLLGDIRSNDNTSLFLELRMFSNDRSSYLGDERSLRNEADCSEDASPYSDCRHQNTSEPRYKSYYPRVTNLYGQYAGEYCLLQGGRRSRDWGLGIFIDSGRRPFDEDSSVYDGVSCSINLQKNQSMGLTVGYEKLAESGTSLRTLSDEPEAENPGQYGPSSPSDDIDQIYFSFEYDDRKTSLSSSFSKRIGIYFANILSKGKPATDIKFLDLYSSFQVFDFSITNEILFRMGRSGDPSYLSLGGRVLDDNGEPARNKVQAIALAGRIDWVISRSGSYAGPEEFRKGNLENHSMSLEYAYAPGDEQGYYDGNITDPNNPSSVLSTTNRSESEARAIAFHRNYKPALILFNAKEQIDSYKIDGVFDPGRVMNASLFALSYQYKSLEAGEFQVKLITASLINGMPSDVKEYYDTQSQRRVGYSGKSLGYEIDLSYSYFLGRDLEIGVAGAFALPGDAWDVSSTEEPVNNFLVQSSLSFHF